MRVKDAAFDWTDFIAAKTNLFKQYAIALVRPVGRCQAFERIDARIKQVVADAAAHFHGVALAMSCWRSVAYNRHVGGARRSQHIAGKALDFRIEGVGKHQLATWVRRHPAMRKLGGVGTYCSEFIHADVGRKRDWNWCRRVRYAHAR